MVIFILFPTLKMNNFDQMVKKKGYPALASALFHQATDYFAG